MIADYKVKDNEIIFYPQDEFPIIYNTNVHDFKCICMCEQCPFYAEKETNNLRTWEDCKNYLLNSVKNTVIEILKEHNVPTIEQIADKCIAVIINNTEYGSDYWNIINQVNRVMCRRVLVHEANQHSMRLPEKWKYSLNEDKENDATNPS